MCNYVSNRTTLHSKYFKVYNVILGDVIRASSVSATMSSFLPLPSVQHDWAGRSTTMRRRVLVLAGLTVSANSYAPAARRSPLKRQVQHADSDSDRVLVSRRHSQDRREIDGAPAESLESNLQGTTADNVNESQVTAFPQSDGSLAGSSQMKPGHQNVSTSLNCDGRRTPHIPHREGGRIQTLAVRRLREALPKFGGDELDRVVLRTAIPSVRSSHLVSIRYATSLLGYVKDSFSSRCTLFA
jgi:hypothetical protein